MEMIPEKTESDSKEQDVTYESFELNSFSEIVKEKIGRASCRERV